METIEHVAIRVGDDIKSLPRPNRHFHIIQMLVVARNWKAGDPPVVGGDDEQGFLTSGGRFVDRTEGYRIARQAGQLLDGVGRPPSLFSEDIW